MKTLRKAIVNHYSWIRLRILLILLRRKKLSIKKILNVLHCYVSYFLRQKKSGASPYLINFDLWNECNETCLFCRTGQGEIYNANPNGAVPYISKGKLRFEVFSGVISELKDYLVMAVPYINGEPLLSKDIYRAIQLATDNRVATMIASNGVILNESNCKKLLDAGLDFIKIHVSGFTQPTHGIEHRLGDVELIKKNIHCLARLNREGGYGMLILLDYILYEHNAHEVAAAREFCEEIGIMLNLRRGNRKGLENMEPPPPPQPSMAHVPCDWLWTVLSIDWNGSVYPCCDAVVWSDTNAFETLHGESSNIMKLWNGNKLIEMRKIHAIQGRTLIPLCAQCNRAGVRFKF